LAVVVAIAKGYDLGYIWKTQDHAAGRTIGGYYIDAAQAGEPPGRWWGPGTQALGLTPGQTVHRQPYNAVYQQIDPRTGAKLGRPRGCCPTFADHLARLQAAEPHATAERLIELERQAAQTTRQPAAYYDVTVSFSKSISVLHASLRENERRARLDGDQQAAAYWAGREETFQEVLHRANRAALEYLQAWAGITRTGYHGTRIDGRESGRFERAGLIVTCWLQGTSREGDPQDHIHNQIARIVRTFRDGKWRALDTMSVRGVLGALQAVAATAVECELSREFGVAWIPRADGRGNEIQGISQAQMDAYSTRTVQVREKERELARAWESKHGRAPTSRELLHIANAATLQSRKDRDARAIDWDALARQWDATLGGELAGIAPAVSDARDPGIQAGEHHAGRAPSGPPTPEAQARALAKALTLVSTQRPVWTRHDLLKQLALVLPAQTRQMNPEEAQELLLGLAEEALSGRSGEVVCLEAPEWPLLPASLRRELDGHSIYTRPGVARYATTAQLSMEERLVAHAQTQGAPRVRGELAAGRLGADFAQLRAALAGDVAHHAREQRELRLDQAIWTAETRDARHDRYRDLVAAALPPERRGELSHRARWLYRTLHAAELAGLDPAEIITSAITARDLSGSRDIAAVLDARIRHRIDPLLPQPQGPWTSRVPQLPDPARRTYLTSIAALMDDRTRRLGQHTAQTAPAWAITALGPVPADPADRATGYARPPPSRRTARFTDTTIPATRSAPNPATKPQTSEPHGTRHSSPSARQSEPTSGPCPTGGCGCSATPTPPRPPGHHVTSGKSCVSLGSAHPTPP
jgi:conjugative relaxase-like TrwC/TraI family protein